MALAYRQAINTFNNHNKFINIIKYLEDGNYKTYLSIYLKKFVVDENGCWIWQGHTNSNGYGVVNIKGTKFKISRFIAFCFIGLNLRNTDLFACHKCDVRNCINPFHLFLGTKSDNFKDAARKGRWHNQYGNKLKVSN